jgi:hypothetical protein
MHPRVTNKSTRTFDVLCFGFEPAGALGSANEHSGLAAEPAPYIGFAGPEHACPLGNVLGVEVTCEASGRTTVHGVDGDRLVR